MIRINNQFLSFILIVLSISAYKYASEFELDQSGLFQIERLAIPSNLSTKTPANVTLASRIDYGVFLPWIKRNPTYAKKHVVPVSKVKLYLSAIIMNESSKLAFINGRFLKEGDSINGFTIKNISFDSVTLKSREREKRIKI